jgi:eukaryotic-like serine/threonine-protein kinase
MLSLSSPCDDDGPTSPIERSSIRSTPRYARPSGHCHQAGELFAGRYRFDRLLGEGGMGAVWRARCLTRGIDVAVKVVRPDAECSTTRGRLLREARTAASLAHPSIVQVFDFGLTDDDEPFLVMELLEGRPLSRWLAEHGRMPAEQAVSLMLPLVSALGLAHSHGVVHRDIKAENVIVGPGATGELVPKLVDFGIVKMETVNDHDVVLTGSGMLIGSPEYMSPEQAEGLVELDARSDQWSFCVLLYELLTGRRPFDGPTVRAVIFSIFSNEPEPMPCVNAGDEALWAIVQRGLQKNPGDRWPSMMHLGQALAEWAAERGVLADAAGTSIRGVWLAPEHAPPPMVIEVPRPVPSPREIMQRAPFVALEEPEEPTLLRARVARGVAAVSLMAVLAVGALAIVGGGTPRRSAATPANPTLAGHEALASASRPY